MVIVIICLIATPVMEKKDYFSTQSKAYAAFRPAYPEALYDFIFEHLPGRFCAWDCATGNGQVAKHLAKHFDSVYATDISQQQIENAVKADNISYSIAAAERSGFESNKFDLITVAQALHWFNTDAFYNEVKRTGKPRGLLAVWGYSLLSVDQRIDELFLDFYNHKIGPYWDEARRLVENHYRDIIFPFEEIPCPEFEIRLKWSARQFAGYLSSWSATQKYIHNHGTDPVEPFMKNLEHIWKPDEVKAVIFPLFLKLGKIHAHVIGSR